MEIEDIKDLVTTHDKHIDLMAQSIENLASVVTTTSSKLDSVIDVMTKQNVLMERVNNLDVNIREAFDRVHAKVKALEISHDGEGCGAMKALGLKAEGSDARLKKIEANITWAGRLIIGSIITGILGSVFIFELA